MRKHVLEVKSSYTEMQNGLYDMLCCAILQENIKGVRAALEKGADPNLRADLASPLYLATISKSTPIIDLLVFAGAEYCLAMDAEKLMALGAGDPNLKRVYLLRDEGVRAKDDVARYKLVHQYGVELDLSQHLRNMESYRAPKEGLDACYVGALQRADGKNFPTPPSNSK